MPRFYFDVHQGELVRDHEGLELGQLDDAIREAIESLPAIAAETVTLAEDRRNFSIIVRGDGGRALYTATLSFCGTRLWRFPLSTPRLQSNRTLSAKAMPAVDQVKHGRFRPSSSA